MGHFQVSLQGPRATEEVACNHSIEEDETSDDAEDESEDDDVSETSGDSTPRSLMAMQAFLDSTVTTASSAAKFQVYSFIWTETQVLIWVGDTVDAALPTADSIEGAKTLWVEFSKVRQRFSKIIDRRWSGCLMAN